MTRAMGRCRWCTWCLATLLLIWFPRHGSTATLDTLLDNMQQTYDRTQALTANFAQETIITSIKREQTSGGRVYIQKPHAIRWEYTYPEAQTILYTHETFRIYTPKRRQMLQSTVEANNRANVALLFLAGLGTLRQTFTITPLPSPDAQTRRLRLLPRSQQASFAELHIVVNRQSYFIENLTIHDHIGNRTTIRLSALQTHPSLPADTFKLVVPPDTEILTPSDLSGQR